MKISPLKTYTPTKFSNTGGICSIPMAIGIDGCDKVSFKSADVDKIDAFNLRNVKDLTCACCGEKMMDEKAFNDFRAKEFDVPSYYALKKIAPYSNVMKKTEKTVFNILRRSSSRDPMSDLNTLIEKKFYFHLNRLEIKQLKIINKATSLKLDLKPKSQKQLEQTISNIKNIMFVESEKQQVRSRIINEFNKLRVISDEKAKIDKMIEVIRTLPDSTNDVDSFMTKYKRRHNKEIANRLLSPSLPTLDHIIPDSKSGEDDFCNLLVLCGRCNEKRGTMPYPEWFKIHPEMPKKNIQKNMDKIIIAINEGKLIDFDTYPEQIKAKLDKVTNGAFVLDTSRLIPKKQKVSYLMN